MRLTRLRNSQYKKKHVSSLGKEMKKTCFHNWLRVGIFMCLAISQTPETMAAHRKCTVEDEKSALSLSSKGEGNTVTLA